MKLFSLHGRTALVTGSGRGLGLGIARGLGEAGAALVINDVDASRADRAVAELQAAGLTARASIFDITQRDAVRAAAEELEQSTGGIDILVNNAGIHCYGPLLDLELAKWQAVLEVNLTGTFLAAQAFAAGMVRRQRGKVINICSLMSEAGRNTTGGYTAAKGGVKMLTKAMAVEWARHNIQANGIGPGYILSDMTRHLADKPEFDHWVKARTPAARWGKPDDLIGAAVFLASPASDFVNGQIIYVDGGILAAL